MAIVVIEGGSANGGDLVVAYPRGLPPEFVPPPIVEPLTSERFMTLLDNFVLARGAGRPKARDELRHAIDELFRRLAT